MSDEQRTASAKGCEANDGDGHVFYRGRCALCGEADDLRSETAQDLKARADALLNSMTPEQVLRWVETGEGWPGHAQRSEAATSDDVSRLDDALTEMGIYLRREQLRDLAARFPALRRDRSEAASPSAWLSETWLELRASLEAALVLLRRFGECAHHEECETFNACENGVYGESETCQFDEDADEVVHDHRSCNCLIWDAASKGFV